jgi:hypothetical protein
VMALLSARQRQAAAAARWMLRAQRAAQARASPREASLNRLAGEQVQLWLAASPPLAPADVAQVSAGATPASS